MHSAFACRHTVMNHLATILRRQILIKSATKSNVHHLQATADAQHRNVAVCRQTGNTEFEHIANGIHLAQLLHGIFAIIRRSHILAPGEQNAIKPAHHTLQIFGGGVGCQHHRYAAGTHHGLHILLAYRTALASCGRNANQRCRFAHCLHCHAIELGIESCHALTQLCIGSCRHNNCKNSNQQSFHLLIYFNIKAAMPSLSCKEPGRRIAAKQIFLLKNSLFRQATAPTIEL